MRFVSYYQEMVKKLYRPKRKKKAIEERKKWNHTES